MSDFRCKECGSADVGVWVWKNLRTGAIGDMDMELMEDAWCNECEAETNLEPSPIEEDER